MSGTNRLLKTPKPEYLNRAHKSKAVAVDGNIGIEETTHLCTKYGEMCDHSDLEPYNTLIDPDKLKEKFEELMDEETSARLMNTEFGQGILMGYIWASIDWTSIEQETELL